MSDELKELKEKLFSTKKNGWDRISQEDAAKIDGYCEGYKRFLDAGKTERLCAKEIVALAEQAGATVVGAGIAIEKVFQGGGEALRRQGLRIESLARIAAMSDDSLSFC